MSLLRHALRIEGWAAEKGSSTLGLDGIGSYPLGFAATLARAVVVLGEILRPSGELSEPKGRVLS
ncbi:hypothetical protein RIE95_06335 [Acidithiobacillus thiooxidans]|uniref:hypothetical protein n=1 Tax=Acidithiobacillus thiooxidans TaxID=930 RepID=UPI002859381A|nr:hypothetical protein [Acidithiobacillus thiooxidans]MDR7926611.1 hypothetical protein [Acidithiobacillus thiooxidans]